MVCECVAPLDIIADIGSPKLDAYECIEWPGWALVHQSIGRPTRGDSARVRNYSGVRALILG